MKNGFLIFFSVLIIKVSIGQANNGTYEEPSPMETAFTISNLTTDHFRATQLKYKDIAGSPYVEKEPLTGYLKLLSGEKTEIVPLQFDMYGAEFFYTDEEGKQLVIDTKICEKIIMKGADENYLFKRADPRTAEKFYDILYEDDQMIIYNDMKIILREGTDAGIIKIPTSFNKDDNYYHLLKGGKPHRIKLKEKDIFKLFKATEQKRMKAYAKENKLKLKKRSAFKQMFDSLTSEL